MRLVRGCLLNQKLFCGDLLTYTGKKNVQLKNQGANINKHFKTDSTGISEFAYAAFSRY